MKKILVVFGTRPETIKMAPIIKEIESRSNLNLVVCSTGQHKEMVAQVVETFGIKVNYNLNIMKPKQNLFDITVEILNKMKRVLIDEKPDLVLVHGDTTTTFVTSLSCFYAGIKIGHVEAGLRTYNLMSPYPEEFNRRSVSILANYNFAPTNLAKMNLINEGVDEKSIYVTGNTVLDAIKTTVNKNYKHEHLDWVGEDKLILVTAHRRENIGKPMENMFRAIKKIASEFKNIKILYPVHLNPSVQEIATLILKDEPRIRLIDPLEVLDFHNFLSRSYIVLTDSGGIQEEASWLNIPVLVMRDTTERSEGVDAGVLKLVGTKTDSIYESFKELLIDDDKYKKMSESICPFGNGTASKIIVDIIEKFDEE